MIAFAVEAVQIDLKMALDKIESQSITQGDCRIFMPKYPHVTVQNVRLNVHKALWLQRYPNYEFARQVAHLSCGNQKCVNADHLTFDKQWKTDKDSVKRNLWKGAIKKGDCFLSPLKPDSNGYGKVQVGGKTYRLHRVVYWLGSEINQLSDLPDANSGQLIRHKCRNKMCLVFEHYEIGSHKDNMLDKVRDGTLLLDDTHPSSKITLKIAQKIADSWKDKSHPNYMTLKARGKMFGVSKGVVNSIDRRINWHAVNHPNGRTALKQKMYEAEERTVSKDDVLYWEGLYTRIQNMCVVDDEPNKYIGTPCWRGSRKINGVHFIRYKRRMKSAYRWAAEFTCKRLALKAEHARHLCGQKTCVNPHHLTLGTQLENEKDKKIHGTAGKKLTLDDVREIRKSKCTKVEISLQYGISIDFVRDILKNKNWKDV